MEYLKMDMSTPLTHYFLGLVKVLPWGPSYGCSVLFSWSYVWILHHLDCTTPQGIHTHQSLTWENHLLMIQIQGVPSAPVTPQPRLQGHQRSINSTHPCSAFKNSYNTGASSLYYWWGDKFTKKFLFSISWSWKNGIALLATSDQHPGKLDLTSGSNPTPETVP